MLVVFRAASSLGSALTGFALNVWLFKQTGSYSMFAALAVVNAVPGLLLAPVAGVLVDRLQRKALLIGCDIACASTIAVIYLADRSGALNQNVVIACTLVLSLARTIAWPAAWAAISSITVPADRPAINGTAESLNGGVTIFAPLLGAMLFEVLGIAGICAIDILSYLLSIAAISTIALRDNPPEAQGQESALRRFGRDCVFGFRWIAAHRALSRLLLYFMTMNLGCSIFGALYVPYVLASTDTQSLGICLTLGGIGMVCGGLLYGVIGNRLRSENAVLIGGFAVGLAMLGFGLMRDVASMAPFAFLYAAGFSVVGAASQTIWQAQVPLDIQGRVFSVRRMVALGLNPLSVLISVPLVGAVMQPLLNFKAGGFQLLKPWGNDIAAPLGLMASLCGLLCATVAVLTYLFDGIEPEGNGSAREEGIRALKPGK